MNPNPKVSARRGLMGYFGVAVTLLSASVLLVSSVVVSAQTLREQMTTTLSDFAGQPIDIEYARPSPAPGISEVQIENGPLIYATDDGAYFFLNGDLHQANASGAVNLTETRRAEARQQQLATVSIDDMVVFAPRGRRARTLLCLPMSPASTVRSFTVRWTSLTLKGLKSGTSLFRAAALSLRVLRS